MVGGVRVVYHNGPHFGLGDGIGEVGVFGDFNGVGEIPGVEPV